MAKLESKDFIRTSLRLPKALVDEFDEITTRQGLNRSNAVAQLMVRYVNEQRLQERTLDSLSNPDVLIKVINSLDKDKIALLKSLESQNKG